MSARLDPSPVSRGDARDLRLGVLVVIAAAALAYLSTVAINGSPFSSPYTVKVPLSAALPVVKVGDEVRLGGERAGQVSSVDLVGRRGQATLDLDHGTVGRGATVRVRPRGLAGAIYVELTPGDARRPLPSGATIPAADTSAGEQLSTVVGGFDRSARAALARTLAGYGGGLAGHGVDLNDSIARTPETLAALTAELRALAGRPGTLGGVERSAGSVATALAPQGDDSLARLLPAARVTLSAAAGASPALTESEARLPALERQASATLPPADRLLATTSDTATALTPGLRALARSLPELRGLENASGRLSSYTRLAAEARPPIDRATPIAALADRPTAALVPVAQPVAQLARVLSPYRREILEAPLGFTRWGDFTYDFGQAPGHRAVRFSMVFTCAHARDPYPKPDAASKERSPCR